LIIILMLSIVLLSYNSTFQTVVVAKKRHVSIISSNSNGQQQQLPPRPPHLIQICCAWGDKLALGILTYQINGGDSAARQAVYNAIGNWNSKLTGIKLVESSGNNVGSAGGGAGAGGDSSNAAQPDIEVSIVSKSLKVPGSTHHRVSSSLGGNSRLMIGGLSQDSFDGNGFLTHVKITIPTNTLGMSFDLSNNIEQIAEHEMGHALGLGHANFVGDLMFPIANFQTGSISQCDVSAVLDANHLKMVGSDTAVLPLQMQQAGYVDCR
ncbi:MAG TPA: matrixin family metalloprotease, partial [Ktedonobacteraceae bacterium]|nr:matrixin family metalloprotease [Ktedonobacteraceae bacterium]